VAYPAAGGSMAAIGGSFSILTGVARIGVAAYFRYNHAIVAGVAQSRYPAYYHVMLW